MEMSVLKNKNIKVMFLVPYPSEGPSNRYRVEQFLPFLKQEGIVCDLYPFMNHQLFSIVYKPKHIIKKLYWFSVSIIRRLIVVCKSINYDAVFVHLEVFPFGPPLLEFIISKIFRKPIIFDFEDAIYQKRKGKFAWLINAVKCPCKFYQIVKLSTQVLVCNRYMKDLCLRYNPNVSILPTSIDTEKFTIKDLNLGKDKIVLGWIGSHSTLNCLLDITEVLIEIAKKADIVLKIVGGGREVFINGVDILNVEWSLEKDVENFQSLDIGLYPLPQNERALAKTPFKTVQYMSVGVPVVASKAGSVDNIIADGINGYLVTNKDEWVDRLLILINDHKKRKEFALNGRKTIEERFSLKVNKHIFLDSIMNSITKNKK